MAELKKSAKRLLGQNESRQIQNIKRIWQFKTKKDVTTA